MLGEKLEDVLWRCANTLKKRRAHRGIYRASQEMSYSDNLNQRLIFQDEEQKRQVILLPTNNTPSLGLINSLTIPTTIRSFLQPGGPDNSRMHPLVNPPPNSLSSGPHPVENVRDCEVIDAADCVRGCSLAEVLFNAENSA